MGFSDDFMVKKISKSFFSWPELPSYSEACSLASDNTNSAFLFYDKFNEYLGQHHGIIWYEFGYKTVEILKWSYIDFLPNQYQAGKLADENRNQVFVFVGYNFSKPFYGVAYYDSNRQYVHFTFPEGLAKVE